MRVLRAKQGDTVSRVLLRAYNRSDDVAEETLHQANPDLAIEGPIIRIGLEIFIPELPEPTTDKVVNVWD